MPIFVAYLLKKICFIDLEITFLLSALRNLVNVILLVFILLYTNKIAVIAPCKRNRIETKSVF